MGPSGHLSIFLYCFSFCRRKLFSHLTISLSIFLYCFRAPDQSLSPFSIIINFQFFSIVSDPRAGRGEQEASYTFNFSLLFREEQSDYYMPLLLLSIFLYCFISNYQQRYPPREVQAFNFSLLFPAVKALNNALIGFVHFQFFSIVSVFQKYWYHFLVYYPPFNFSLLFLSSKLRTVINHLDTFNFSLLFHVVKFPLLGTEKFNFQFFSIVSHKGRDSCPLH